MYKFCVFAGTREGRQLALYLTDRGAEVKVCVATDYGETLLPPARGLTVSVGQLGEEDMEALLRSERFDLVLDATHPYAAQVTENLRRACAAAETEYLRVLRPDSAARGVCVPDAAAAVEYLSAREGNVLLTTGSRNLKEFAALPDFARRVWARVLPLPESLESCAGAGLPPSHIIAMQGPFSRELNLAQMNAVRARFLVTKDGGAAGGFEEKADAARRAGADLVVLGRPPAADDGKSMAETLEILQERFGFVSRPRVDVAGIGPGGPGGMTAEVREAIAGADCLIGSRRALDAAGTAPGQRSFAAVAPEDIAALIRDNPDCRGFAVLMSGDPGFFSGTKRLLPLLEEYQVRVLPGLSSLTCLCARLGESWDDVFCVSLHGRERDFCRDVAEHYKVFFLMGGKVSVRELCRALTEEDFSTVRVTVGERLGYPEERVTSGTAEELSEEDFDPLSVVLVENKAPDFLYRDGPEVLRPFPGEQAAPAAERFTPGLPDDDFVRAEGVPMTKSEVRAVCLSKLRLTPEAVAWDVGAGSGSVTVEMALAAPGGQVYAVEHSDRSLECLRRNLDRFGTKNVTVVPGAAPRALEDLPAPTHLFLGGGGHCAREILTLALQKNPAVRVVAAALTLETQAILTGCVKELGFDETEVVSVTVARDRTAGPYHMMMGQNPIYIYTMGRKGERA